MLHTLSFLPLGLSLMLQLSSCQNSEQSAQGLAAEAKGQASELLADAQQDGILSSRALWSEQMPRVLDEISGIAFDPDGDFDMLYAIEDETGVLYSYSLTEKKVVSEFKFAGRGDYEDVATDGKYFYVLRSDGVIYSFDFDLQNSSEKEPRVTKGLLPKGEYESLAINPDNGRLYVMCKECKVDKKGGQHTGYEFSTNKGKVDKFLRIISIDLAGLRKIDKDIKKIIKPSAITYDREAKRWFMISSIDKALMIFDEDFKIKKIEKFARSAFEQPEGLAINYKSGELLISSERGDSSYGMLKSFTLK